MITLLKQFPCVPNCLLVYVSLRQKWVHYNDLMHANSVQWPNRMSIPSSSNVNTSTCLEIYVLFLVVLKYTLYCNNQSFHSVLEKPGLLPSVSCRMYQQAVLPHASFLSLRGPIFPWLEILLKKTLWLFRDYHRDLLRSCPCPWFIKQTYVTLTSALLCSWHGWFSPKHK